MSRVFISGSISIKKIPDNVIESLEKIQQHGLEVLVGDADGIDRKIQDYFKTTNYENVCVYSIYNPPRNISSPFFGKKLIMVEADIKKERERQTLKDTAMTEDSDYSLVIWDGKSKGSHKNILRALELQKKVKVYLTYMNQFINQQKVNKNEIDFIYYENNGYSAKEIVEYLTSEGKEYFKNTRALNKYLIDRKIIGKSDDIYIPLKNKELFIIETYRGKNSGLRFKNEFIDWLEATMVNPGHQDGLF
tara:strand:+ start:1009 stop:1752 length:744 start_codon:yes stop_codon:yes gene_type:complete